MIDPIISGVMSGATSFALNRLSNRKGGRRVADIQPINYYKELCMALGGRYYEDESIAVCFLDKIQNKRKIFLL